MPAITRAKSAIFIDQQAMETINKELKDAFRTISDFKIRTQILRDGGEILLEEARRLAPVGKPRKRDHSIDRYFPPKKLREDIHYTYDTPKINKGKKAGAGYGRVSGKYAITNLKHSIVDIADTKKRLRTYKVVIGPLYTKRKSVVNPEYGKANGWYAHMIYGSARAFRERVTGRALQNTQERVWRTIKWEIEYRVGEIASKNQYVK